jgi:exonuclease III
MKRLPLRLVTWNVNGLRAFIARKRREHGWRREQLSDDQVLFECFVRELRLAPSGAPPDVICLQELKTRSEDFPDHLARLEHPSYPFWFEGYFSFCASKTQGKTVGYAGVAVYVRCSGRASQFDGCTWEVWRAEEGLTGELPARCLEWPSAPPCARELLERLRSGQISTMRREQQLPTWRALPELHVGDYPEEWSSSGEALGTAEREEHRQLDEEGRALVLDVCGLILVHVYVPNAANEERLFYKQRFLTCLEDRCLHLVRTQNRIVVILGDLNTAHERIDHCNPQEAEREAAKLYPKLLESPSLRKAAAGILTGHPAHAPRFTDGAESEQQSALLGTLLPGSASHTAGVTSRDASAVSTEKVSAPNDRIVFETHPSRVWLHRMLSDDLFRDLFREKWPNRRDAYSCWNTQTQARLTNYGTRIDYILLSCNAGPYLRCTACDLLPNVMGSDHCPCVAELAPVIDTEKWPWTVSNPCVPLRYSYHFHEKQTSLRHIWQNSIRSATGSGKRQRHGLVNRMQQGHLRNEESESVCNVAEESSTQSTEAQLRNETQEALCSVADSDNSLSDHGTKPHRTSVSLVQAIERQVSQKAIQGLAANSPQSIITDAHTAAAAAAASQDAQPQISSDIYSFWKQHQKPELSASEAMDSRLSTRTTRAIIAELLTTGQGQESSEQGQLDGSMRSPHLKRSTNALAACKELPVSVPHHMDRLHLEREGRRACSPPVQAAWSAAAHGLPCGSKPCEAPHASEFAAAAAAAAAIGTPTDTASLPTIGSARTKNATLSKLHEASAGSKEAADPAPASAQQLTLERYIRRTQPQATTTRETPLVVSAQRKLSDPLQADEMSSRPSVRKTDTKAWRALLAVPSADSPRRGTPRCHGHQEPAVLRTVKQGPHRGRQFYVCRRPAGPIERGGRCNFFQWKTALQRESVTATASNSDALVQWDTLPTEPETP